MGWCVGLSGGICSGKSTVSHLFEQLGVDIIDTDHIARQLTEQPDILSALRHYFGDSIFSGQALNRKALRKIIFQEAEAKQWLEDLLHPKIWDQAILLKQQSQATYSMMVVPLLYDRDRYPLDRICMLICDTEVQVKRIGERDQLSPDAARLIIEQQPDLATKLNLADDIIDSNADLHTLPQRVKELHLQYTEMATM